MRLIPRSRRGWMVLGVLALAFALGAWWVNRQLEPRRLTAIVLGQLGSSLKLDLRFDGLPDYALRPEPRLLIPNLVATDPSNGQVILRTERLEVSLPWATITGGYPVITRLELRKPQLDLPALQHWLASLPKTPFKLPTLTKGLRIEQGHVQADGWQLNAVDLSLPRLKQNEAAAAELSMHFLQDKTDVSFAGTMQVATAGLSSDIQLKGQGELEHVPKPLAYSAALDGHYLSDDSAFHLDAKSLHLQGDSLLPTLTLSGNLAVGTTMSMTWQGELAQWPKDWPALPAPLNEAKGPLPIQLAYQGKPDLSDILTLDAAVGESKFHSNLRLPQVQTWLAADNAAPLPPLNGTLVSPQLNVSGLELKGVSVEIEDDPPAAAAATKP
jgi:hypothetical protein